MQGWTVLNAFDVDKAAPKAIRDKAAKLQKRVEQMKNNRAALDADVELFKAEPDATKLAAEGFEKQRALKLRETELLQDELTLRDELAAAREEYQSVLLGLQDAAFSAEKEVRAEVLAGLAELGFPCGPGSDQQERRVYQQFCLRNLRVRNAVARVRDLHAWQMDRSYAKTNSDAAEVVRKKLQQTRDQLTAI